MGELYTTVLIAPLANGLILFYNLFGNNLGLAIIFFSLFLRLVLNPLTKPYMNSMKRMRELAPNIEKLKKKYKGNRTKLAQAQSELYKQQGINPTAGCLPYLLQIVILIAFFGVFTRTLSQGNPVENFNKLLYQNLQFQEGESVNTRFLYLDVTKPDKFEVGLPFALPGPVIIFAALLQFLSAKIMQPQATAATKLAKKTKGPEDDIQAAMQSSMIYTFPLMTLVFGLSFPAGLALYWAMFSLWQLVNQYLTSGPGALKPFLRRFSLLKSASK